MIKLIKNGTVITMDKNRKQYENLDIVIKDDLIIEVTDNYNGFYDELIDASNKIVMPGLINCHVHLAQAMLRGMADDLDLMPMVMVKEVQSLAIVFVFCF